MFKILTFNLQGFGRKYGTWERRQLLIRDIIEQASPDIIALQAVRRSRRAHSLDQVAQLAHLLPRYEHVVFRAAKIHADGSADGLGFLSRSRPARVEVLHLTRRPGHEDPYERILLHGRYELAGGPLHLFNAHLSWVAAQAMDNVQEILPYVNGIVGPRLLVGDLNQPPDSPPIHSLRQAGWEDAWQRLHADQPGLTFREGDELTKRIDYAWANNGLKSHIRAVEIVGDCVSADGIRPSDHVGLLVTVG